MLAQGLDVRVLLNVKGGDDGGESGEVRGERRVSDGDRIVHDVFENGAMDEFGEFESGILWGTDDAVEVPFDHSGEKMSSALAKFSWKLT